MNAVACFTFDNLGEAADVGAGAGVTPSTGHPSIEIGLPALLRLLEQHAIRATFFVEGWNGVNHPDAVLEIVRRGHELGMHGWVHEEWSGLDAAREGELAQRATEALAQAADVRPRGFRAPGGRRTASTETILRGLGYDYDASLGDGMRPLILDSGLAQIPFVWPGVDGFHYLRQPPVAPEHVRDTWLAALHKTAERGGLFLIVGHPFLTGVEPQRLAALSEVMSAAVADERVEILTAGELADRLLGKAASAG